MLKCFAFDTKTWGVHPGFPSLVLNEVVLLRSPGACFPRKFWYVKSPLSEVKRYSARVLPECDTWNTPFSHDFSEYFRVLQSVGPNPKVGRTALPRVSRLSSARVARANMGLGWGPSEEILCQKDLHFNAITDSRSLKETACLLQISCSISKIQVITLDQL